MIVCRNLTKSYRIGTTEVAAVTGVDLEIPAGEHLAILGHSGSGKSTLVGMLGGLTRPSAGTVTIAGDDIWQHSDDIRAGLRNTTLGLVFQHASLVPTLSVRENVLLPALFGAGVTADVRRRASDLIAAVGLADRMEALPAHLSGGQQRRAAIARAFINEPRIVIADEPTGDLDEGTEAAVMRLLTRQCRGRGANLIVVTHDREIARAADRAITMKAGRLI